MTLQKIQSGTELAQSGTEKIRRLKRLGKTHQDYWKRKLKKRSYAWDGTTVEIAEWQIRIHHLGRREWFNTGTANQTAASIKARDIYLSLLTHGWEPTLARFKPDQVVATGIATVGEYLDAVKTNSALRHATFEIYARKFRTLVAGTFGLQGGVERFDYVKGGHKKWLERVHRIRLDRITPDRVERWKIRYLKAAEQNNPLALKRARTTLNSVIRGGKSLFTAAVTGSVKVKLPNPLPLQGVCNVPVERTRYRSTIDPRALAIAAKKDLAANEPEAFKIFLLALCAGLRRDEIDRHADLGPGRFSARIDRSGNYRAHVSQVECQRG